MQDELVTVFHARTVEDAQRLADRLTRAGVEAFVDTTVAPMYGLPVGPRGKIVRVRAPERGLAERVVADFEGRSDRGLTEEEWEQEEGISGFEEPTIDKPSAEDPVQNYNVDNERLSDDDPEIEAPELAGTIDPDDPRRSPSDNRIVGYHPDRGDHDDPVIERDEIQDRKIDDLDPDEDSQL